MRITILTQSDPFFLAENIDYLVKNLPVDCQIVSTVLFDVTPFGKRETFLQKATKSLKIFGYSFFLNYSFKFLIRKLNPNKSVKRVLQNHNIPIIQLEYGVNHPKSLDVINSHKPDLLISIAANEIFKKPLLELPPKGCINLHSALLPKYRGLMPSFWVLKNNETETGVSVFFIDEGIDSGPILVQKRIPVHSGMTQAELIKKSKAIGMIAIIEAIELIRIGKYQLIPNSESDKTYFPFPTKNDVKCFFEAGRKFY